LRDVRIIAATNQNLAQMGNERRFRADLYYPLNVFPILPPLRDRVQDIPQPVQHFVQLFARFINTPTDGVPESAMHALYTITGPETFANCRT
jgi:transcriptional regulator with GAF, ATPase, and Fis domain